MTILLRLETWLTSDDHSALKRAIAPARWIDADTETPLDLAEWDRGWFMVLVTALEGNAFVEIASSGSFDPESSGHLILEGQTGRWLVLAGSLMIKEFKKG